MQANLKYMLIRMILNLNGFLQLINLTGLLTNDKIIKYLKNKVTLFEL